MSITFRSYRVNCLKHNLIIFTDQGPGVQRSISTNQGFNPGFYISLYKSHFRIFFPVLFKSIQSSNCRQMEFY